MANHDPSAPTGSYDSNLTLQSADFSTSHIPERIGRYRVERLLGKGGFGEVYLAHDEELKRPVAVKVPRPELISHPADAELYLAEARTVARLDHPQIAPVHDVGRTEQHPCFVVSKYIEGMDLAKWRKQHRPTVGETAELVATVAEALHYAHKCGIVHRDVKPGNILIDLSGKAFVVDFGLALRDQDSSRSSRFAGTPAYMSPEQGRGEGHRVDGRSDIFSLGVVLYELLVGKRPFHADSRPELLEVIATIDPKPPRQIDDQIPRELERICLKCLSKRASERYTTASDLADDLRHLVAGGTSMAKRAPAAGGGADGSAEAQKLQAVTRVSTAADTGGSSAETAQAAAGSSDNRPLRIVPKGLRSFDAHDAYFFLELLPGPRDRDGLPDSIRFWKTRIEESDADETFSVGLIYGPSGCGKSSLVKAGLLPTLSNNVIVVYLEASASDTESRLLNGLRKRCPALPGNGDLKDTMTALRRGQGIAHGNKVLIVLDQFEQWLHGRRDERNTELVQALRQCDGAHLQCLVMVRDDFWMAVTRFLIEIEVELIQGRNVFPTDLFDARHATKVLTAFGQAFGALPEKSEEISSEQQEFLRQSVSGLTQEGKVICVRLALFAEMMKGKPWTPAMLRSVGGTEGIGVTYLEETFSSKSANPKHRYHQVTARAVLRALLPELGTEIKGHLRSYAELLEASGFAGRRGDFDELIRILDSEVRLITPSDPDGNSATQESVPVEVPGQKYYQLTHDYLVPSLREWLTRKQRETRRGRAELHLAEHTALWHAKPVNRNLPSLWEFLNIRLLTPKDRWTDPQRRMMRRATRFHQVRAAIGSSFATMLIVVLVAVFWINRERNMAVAAEKTAQTERDTAIAARAQEEIAKTEAVKHKEKAEELHEKASIAQALAEDAQRKAELAKKQEEYEAYIARIGLVAARIEENAFGSARELLEGCKPELRNWEWGRLMYLCGLSLRSVNVGAPIDSVAFSPDGTRFVTGGWNHAAQIFESASGKLLFTIPCGGLYVHAVAYSPDGKYVATGGNDPGGYVGLWNAQTGEAVKRPDGLSGHTDAALSVVFTPDGKKLLTASYDKTARLWDVETGRELRVFRGHSWWVWSAAFSRDEKFIVTASQDGSAIVWDAASGERISQFLGHQGPVYSAAFSPDGGRVVSGGYDKRVLVWRPADVRKFDFVRVAQGKEVEPVRFRTLEGHAAPVRSVSFSSDGSLIVSGGHDNTVKVWDADSGRTLITLRGHDSWVRSCAFSPDGRTVVSAGHDNRATLWSITDYEEMRVLQGRVLQGHNDAVLSASFNRDGTSIVTASRDRSAKTWDFATGNEIQSFEEGHAFLASNAVFFPGGKRLLTSAVDNTVRFWDVSTGTQTARLDNTGRSAALALSPDGKRILTGSNDHAGGESTDIVERTAKLWDADSKEIVKVLKGHKVEVTAVAFSPDGKWFFTGDASGHGIVWNAETGREIFSRGQNDGYHTRRIVAAAFLPDGTRVLTASTDKTVAQLDLKTGKEMDALVLRHPGAVVSMALVPGKRQVLTSSSDRTVYLWDLDKAQVVRTLPVAEDTNSVAVSSDGTRALTVNSEMRTVRLWDLESGREILAPQAGDRLGQFLDLKQTRGLVWTASFSPDSDLILTVGGSDARLWDMQKGAERMRFSPSGIVASAGFSPDGSRIVTGSWDNSARIWDTSTGKDVLKLEGHTRSVNSAVYSPDGSQILTAGDDRTAILWNAQSGAVIRALEGHADRLRSAVFSPDGKQILTASYDKTARLWNAETGEPLGKLEGHKWAVLSAVFSPDGTKVITGSEDNTARIWETATQKLLKSLEGHTAPVASVTFLPDPQVPEGTRVLTGSQDNTAKLWDAQTGKEILTLKGHSQEVTCVNASLNGRYVLTSSRDGTTVVWLAIDWNPKRQQAAIQPAMKNNTATQNAPAQQPVPIQTPPTQLARNRSYKHNLLRETERIILEVLADDGRVTETVWMKEQVLDDLPGLFRRFPDGHYRLYFVEAALERMRVLFDVILRGGKPGLDPEENPDLPPNPVTAPPFESIGSHAGPL